jgi:hypothetical protein
MLSDVRQRLCDHAEAERLDPLRIAVRNDRDRDLEAALAGDAAGELGDGGLQAAPGSSAHARRYALFGLPQGARRSLARHGAHAAQRGSCSMSSTYTGAFDTAASAQGV